MEPAAPLAEFAKQKYLSLETFRRNGIGVRTPVWFAADRGAVTLYVYTTADSGKAKRIRANGTVRIAPCDMRGKITGAWTSAHAKIVDGQQYDAGMRLLDRKYGLLKWVLDVSARLSGRHGHRVMFAIQPRSSEAPLSL